MEKTNAMRILERGKAAYTVHAYEGGALSGVAVAQALGEDVGGLQGRSSPSVRQESTTSLSFPLRRNSI